MTRVRCAVLTGVALGAMLSTAAGAAGARSAPACDPIDPAACQLPWPNDRFTVRDASTATGRRLDLVRDAMPRNLTGVAIDPTDMNRADGFSPGSAMLTKIPGLDTPEAARASALPSLSDLGESLRPGSPVVVIEARSRRRQIVWAEIDANPASPADRVLIIRPGRNFEEGHRYIVALRGLRDAGGAAIAPSPAFRTLRDRLPTRDADLRSRRGHFESIFRTLRRAGIGRRGLYLAWDFTVAGRRSLTSRALAIRDDAFAKLGDRDLADRRVDGRAPVFTIDRVEDRTPAQDDRIARRVEGSILAPCYLTNGCAPGGRFVLDARGLPMQQGVTAFRWYCNVPRVAIDPADRRPARPAIYGHGLLGSPTEIDAGNVKSMAQEHDFIYCATAWAGFASEDLGWIAGTVVTDFSSFDTVADRMQQGFVQQLLLGRALIHPQGLGSSPAFQQGGRSLIDTRRLYFDGNSQGGIMGGALTALSPDLDRAVLGVPGMNYSTLLQRSVDFDAYAQVIYPNYPRLLDRQLFLAQIQLLWDRGESDGYAAHITSRPLPNTPPHTVLMHVAVGDHQVADITPAIMARTFGARVRTPAIDPGRSELSQPLYGLQPITAFPYHGSALVYWDVGPVRTDAGGQALGVAPSPLANVPNRVGEDPHGAPRGEASARFQKAAFLAPHGAVYDVCAAARPCYARGWMGP